MRTEGRRELRRPVGAVLRPVGLLVAAVASGFGMWHALVQDGASTERHARHERAPRVHVESARP